MPQAAWICEEIEEGAGADWVQTMNALPAAATIAVVDDDQSVRESVASLVESVGYDVDLFASAEEFLEAQRVRSAPPLEDGYKNDFGCLILDVLLPGISGIDLHKHLTSLGRSIPTIFITAHADLAIAIESGVVGVLYKPFQPEVLLAAVASAIHQSRS